MAGGRCDVRRAGACACPLWRPELRIDLDDGLHKNRRDQVVFGAKSFVLCGPCVAKLIVLGVCVLAYVFSGLALASSLASLSVSVLTYRMAGPRVTLDSQHFTVLGNEVWLRVKIVNVGKGEIDVDGATCDLLGSTVTTLPHRMKSASSHHIEFHAPASGILARSGSVTVNIGLGNGRTLTRQVRATGVEQAQLRRSLSGLQNDTRTNAPTTWLPPIQEEL